MSIDQEKIKKILEIDNDPKVVLFDHIQENSKEHQELYNEIEELEKEFNDKIQTIELTPGPQGEQGDKGEPGRDGKDGKDGKAGKDGKRGERGLQGLTGASGIDGIDGKDGEKGEQGEKGDQGDPPEHEWKGTSLRFKNADGTWGEWKNLKGEQGDKGRVGESRVVGYGSAHDQRMKRADLSSQCDGSNMEFTLPEQFKPESLVLQSTQFPIIYRPEIDYQVTGANRITLQSSEVGPPQSGQTLIALYVKL